MAQKYKNILIKKVKEDRAFKKRQENLKKKHNIKKESSIVVVEKSNTFKFTVKTFGNLVRLLITIIILTLAFVGITALVYPMPRENLVSIFKEALRQIQSFLL